MSPSASNFDFSCSASTCIQSHCQATRFSSALSLIIDQLMTGNKSLRVSRNYLKIWLLLEVIIVLSCIYFRYEAAILVVLYLIYILLMYFNRFLEKKSIDTFERLKKKYIKKEKIEESDNVSEERQPLSGKSWSN